ncbi:hypothetical protein BGX21_003136 [Mortierella sp. AD011]|nr:hypothetical protein BGX21_003136 [Mortierella sp. AD011]
MAFSGEEFEWIQKNDKISPESYFDKFRSNGLDYQVEHQRYSRLLDNGFFTPSCLKLLRDNFESWKINKAHTFWLDRRTRNSAMRTAAKLVEGSETFACQSIDRNSAQILEQDQEPDDSQAHAWLINIDRFVTDQGGANSVDGPQDDLDRVLDDDTGKLATPEELEEIAEWTPAKSSPFYEIAQYIYDKVNRKPALLPSLPTDISTNHKEMFEKAVSLLRKTGDVTRKKEVFVLVSGIINTVSNEGLGFRLSEQIVRESFQTCMTYKSDVVTQLIAEFMNSLYPDGDAAFAMSMPNLQSFIYRKLAEDTVKWMHTKDDHEQYVVLKMMNLILLWLEHSHFECPVSEHVYVSAWSSIFNTLFAAGGLRVIPGELGSQASKHFRQLTEQEFGIKSSSTNSRMARKVDQTLRVMVDGAWSGEVAIFESKPVVSDATCRIQHSKSIRLNAAILLELESHGLDICQWHPIIAETRAATVDFYTIKKYEDVLGVGRATIQKCWIPTHSSQLKGFLRSGTLEMLLGFRAHLMNFASEATAVLASNPPSPFPVPLSPQIPIMRYRESSVSPGPQPSSSSTERPPTPNIKRSRPFVMFGPCKPKSKKVRVEDDDEDDQDDDVEY